MAAERPPGRTPSGARSSPSRSSGGSSLPAVLRVAEDRGWWAALDELDRPRVPEADDEDPGARPAVRVLDPAALDALRPVHGVLPVAGRGRRHEPDPSGAAGGATVVGAVDGDRLVGVAIAEPAAAAGPGLARLAGARRGSRPPSPRPRAGPAQPPRRDRGRHRSSRRSASPSAIRSRRCPWKPARGSPGRSSERAGFRVSDAPDPIGRHDPTAIVARR